MENVSQFDLNASLSRWLERLAQSPHFRNEHVTEMESHVRDSVSKLQSQGLTEEESFLIAIRQVGTVGKLEPEFAKVNRDWLNVIIHGLILAFFSVGCWFLWGVMQDPRMLAGSSGQLDREIPRFTQLLMDYSQFLVVPPLLALAYCLHVVSKKSNPKTSWMGFFAATFGAI